MSPCTALSRPHPAVWQISLASPPDNRLTPSLLESLAADLDTVEAEWRRSGGGANLTAKKRGDDSGAGALVLASSCENFFSNGLDYEKSLAIPDFFENVFDPVMYRLLTFPLLTIAAINGHAFAAGMVMALCCDYRLMTSGKGLVCMNEITFGAPLPNSFSAFLNIRIPNARNLRDTLLARRWTQAELMEIDLVDEIVNDTGEPGALVRRAVEVGIKEGPRVSPGSWGTIKDGIYHSVQDASRSHRPVRLPVQEAEAFWDRIGTQTGDKAKAKL